MNKIILLGRITKNLELKKTNNAKYYLKFCIAVKREYVKDGVDFINCVAWEKTAEVIKKYFFKGDRILIEGRLNNNSYEKNGETKTHTEVFVDKVGFIEIRNQDKKEAQELQEIEDDEFPF